MLDLHGRSCLAVFEPHDPAVMWIPRNIAGGLHRIHQPHALGKNAFLEQIQHQRGGPDLQRGRVLAHVRIANEQMQAAILAVIGQRFVTGIDDRAVELHPLVDVVHDVVGTLRNLKVHRLIVAAVVKLEGEGIGLADAAGCRKKSAASPETTAVRTALAA